MDTIWTGWTLDGQGMDDGWTAAGLTHLFECASKVGWAGVGRASPGAPLGPSIETIIKAVNKDHYFLGFVWELKLKPLSLSIGTIARGRI